MTAQHLVKAHKVALQSNQLKALDDIKERFNAKKLTNMIGHGIAFHHAGLSFGDRQIIENLFRTGNLPILVCTNTLAMGVNLPAYLVVIRSTNVRD